MGAVALALADSMLFMLKESGDGLFEDDDLLDDVFVELDDVEQVEDDERSS